MQGMLGLSLSAAIVGCGIGTQSLSTVTTAHRLQGTVHGGQQAVTNSVIQLWAAGQTGNGSAPQALISATVLTDGSGNFNIDNDYTCPSPSAQVYITSTGGNPGLGPGGNNPSLKLMAALGSCGNLSAATNVFLDEVTTVAAVWALAPFMDASGNVGSSATNTVGLQNAFLNAGLLADTTTGLPPTLPAGKSIETGKVYALANSLSGCVNSDGSNCTALFTAATPPGGAAPTDSVIAALDVVRNPGNNVTAVYRSAPGPPPYVSSLTGAPNDWTMSLTINNGGLNLPTAAAVDGYGNVWVANYYGVVSAFSPQGAPLAANGYNISANDAMYGLTVDANNNVWVSHEETPAHDNVAGSVTLLYGVNGGAAMGTPIGGNTYLYTSGIDWPHGLAADTNGNVLVANYAKPSASVFNSSGTDIADGYAYTSSSVPVALSADSYHGLWIANFGDATVTHLDSAGNLRQRPSCCDGATGVSVDSQGNAWVSSYYGSYISEISDGGNVTLSNLSGGGVNYPTGIMLDAAQTVWVSNYYGNSFTEMAGNGASVAAGTALSPSTGFGLDAKLAEPTAITIDPSGNLWLPSYNGNTLTMFFGLAKPTSTPHFGIATAP
jgi:streptogramin lyase